MNPQDPRRSFEEAFGRLSALFHGAIKRIREDDKYLEEAEEQLEAVSEAHRLLDAERKQEAGRNHTRLRLADSKMAIMQEEILKAQGLQYAAQRKVTRMAKLVAQWQDRYELTDEERKNAVEKADMLETENAALLAENTSLKQQLRVDSVNSRLVIHDTQECLKCGTEHLVQLDANTYHCSGCGQSYTLDFDDSIS